MADIFSIASDDNGQSCTVGFRQDSTDERSWNASVFLSDERGAAAVEYALIVALAALGIAGGLGALAELIAIVFDMLVTVTAEARDGINTTP